MCRASLLVLQWLLLNHLSNLLMMMQLHKHARTCVGHVSSQLAGAAVAVALVTTHCLLHWEAGLHCSGADGLAVFELAVRVAHLQAAAAGIEPIGGQLLRGSVGQECAASRVHLQEQVAGSNVLMYDMMPIQ